MKAGRAEETLIQCWIAYNFYLNQQRVQNQYKFRLKFPLEGSIHLDEDQADDSQVSDNEHQVAALDLGLIWSLKSLLKSQYLPDAVKEVPGKVSSC